MENFGDFKLFKDGKEEVSFEDILREIYGNTKRKNAQIKELVEQLKGMVRNPADATMLVPLIGEYLEASVKNDAQLVQMAGIVARLIPKKEATGTGTIEDLLSDDEKAQLYRETEAALKKGG
jgi:hypothetical protein